MKTFHHPLLWYAFGSHTPGPDPCSWTQSPTSPSFQPPILIHLLFEEYICFLQAREQEMEEISFSTENSVFCNKHKLCWIFLGLLLCHHLAKTPMEHRLQDRKLTSLWDTELQAKKNTSIISMGRVERRSPWPELGMTYKWEKAICSCPILWFCPGRLLG